MVSLGVPTILQNFGKSYKKDAAAVNLLPAKSELVLHLTQDHLCFVKLFLSLGDHTKTSVLWKRKAKIHNEYSQCVQINTECGRNFVLFYRVYDFVPFLC